MGGHRPTFEGTWWRKQRARTPPLPADGAFDGQMVLVTGGTGDLGVAAAAHFLRLGAAEVIITARSTSSTRAEDARRKILAEARGSGVRGADGKEEEEERNLGELTVMELDMNSYGSCVRLVEGLKARFHDGEGAEGGGGGGGGAILDVAVLNAGGTNNRFVRSPEGQEETIQVNTLSTVLLALLLLPWMRQKRRAAAGGGRAPARVVLVSSRSHVWADVSAWPAYLREDGGVIAHFAREENFPAGVEGPLYPASKLMLQYAVEGLSGLALDSSGDPDVIITSVCPGIIWTRLTNRLESNSLVIRLFMPVYYYLLATSADHGTRIYLEAALAGAEDHGKYLRHYGTPEDYQRESAPVISSDMARSLQSQVWREIKEILSDSVPAVRKILRESP